MADMNPSASVATKYSPRCALTHDLEDAECVGTSTVWVDLRNSNFRPTALAIVYDETGGGMTQAIFSLLAKVGGSTEEYPLSHPVTTAVFTHTIAATGNHLIPIATMSTVPWAHPLEGVDEIGVKVAITGTGTTGNIVKATLVGGRAGE